jgi:hypothetical protein
MSDAGADRGYRPVPLDTSHVQLTEELTQLIEILAERAHDTWAAARFKTGWEYGPHRDDSAQRHPCLVPYADLSEAEKDIDREVVMATVTMILAHGYELRRPGD